MKERAIFDHIVNISRQTIYYVPRTYKTVGGMWTVDTYKNGDVTIQIMDEGWTSRLISPSVVAMDSGGHFKIEKGTLQDFEELLENFT